MSGVAELASVPLGVVFHREMVSDAKPQDRVPVNIPTNWCLTCELTLRTEEEYFAHIDLFPTHHVKAINRLICPACGNNIPLVGGCFTEHWIGNREARMCTGSGKQA